MHSYYRCLPFFIVLFIFGAGVEALAQPKFLLKRTKRETNPFFIQIYGGYNGVSDPAEVIQDRVRDVDGNTYGGVMLGLQAAFQLDTVLYRPLWLGGEFYYHRYVNRDLRGQPDVYYVDEPGSVVEYIEQLFAVGAQIFIAYDPIKRLQIQAGGGVQYLYPQVDIPTETEGLFEAHVIPTVFVGGKVVMLSYLQGSIDANIRLMKGFGEYGSIELQSLLGFTFNF